MLRPPPNRKRTLGPIVGAGVAVVAIALVLGLSGQSHRALVVGAFVLAGVLLLAGVIFAASKAEKARKSGIGEVCEELGLEQAPAKALPDRAGAFAPFAHLKVLRTGAKGLAWIARDPAGRDPLVLFEHSYVISTGNSTSRITHTAAALPCPGAWPEMTLTPEHLGHKVAALFGRRDVQLDDPEFNKCWFVQADDEQFALLAIGPEMQAWLLEAPKRPTFHLAKGLLVCLERRRLDGEGLRRLVGTLRGFESRLPPELAAYAPGA